MNADDFARDTLSRLQTPKSDFEIFLDFMRICRLYEAEYTHSFNAEAFARNTKHTEWFERMGDDGLVEYYHAERLGMLRKKATWQGICAFLDATTDAEMMAADDMIGAADKLPAPEYHSKNGNTNHVPAKTALGDFIRGFFSASHPVSDTPEYYRFAEAFLHIPMNTD